MKENKPPRVSGSIPDKHSTTKDQSDGIRILGRIMARDLIKKRYPNPIDPQMNKLRKDITR